ncbi:hypothetical protein QFZ75_006702 [Streptomyces sp. V3I8]|nr:hypothetical protein [Streptomyces sp. V3I8]
MPASSVRRGAVKPLRAALPVVLAGLAPDGAVPPARGLGELPAVAAECAERTGGREDLAHLAQTAQRRGSSRLVTQARRLRAALEQGGGRLTRAPSHDLSDCAEES